MNRWNHRLAATVRGFVRLPRLISEILLNLTLALGYGSPGPATAYLLGKLISLMTSIFDGKLISSSIVSLASIGERPAVAVEQLCCSLKCFRLSSNQGTWGQTTEPSGRWSPYVRISWINILDQMVKVATVADRRSLYRFLHFSISQCPSSVLRPLVN